MSSRLSTTCLVAALVAACAERGAPPEATRAGDLTLRAALNPDPPRQKGNTLVLNIVDAQDRPVDGAEVAVIASMPSMAWVPGMRSRAAVEPKGQGRYLAKFDVVMGGTWSLGVAVRSVSGDARAEYAFAPGSRGLQAMGGAIVAPQPEERVLTGKVVEALRPAFAAYDEVRGLLAQDRSDGIAPAAARLGAALAAARNQQAGPPAEVGACLENAVAAAARLGAATDLPAARQAFGEVSRFLVALAAVEPRLIEGVRLFECPMTETFNLWLQREPEPTNPYFGTSMLTCGSERPWGETVGEAMAESGGTPAAPGEISHYSCSMHTDVRSARPGTCPICSMNLVPVTRLEVQTGEIVVDELRRQTIGVRTGTVVRRPIATDVRAVGRVVYDETRLSDVSVKIAGWIEDLAVDATGQRVRAGQTLFTLYSPELYAAQEELLTALRSQQAARSTSAPDRVDDLVAAARLRLRLWDVADGDIDQVVAGGKPQRTVPIKSPVSGHVIEKHVVRGAAVMPGAMLYRIAGLDRVWVEAEVHEAELAHVATGQEARVVLPYLLGRELSGRVSFLYPYLGAAARTGRVRIELANPSGDLKPDMYAEVTLRADRGERLVVPESAVVFAGQRRLVFLDLGGGRLRPQPVEVGVRSGSDLEVLSGLAEGDVVVTSGTFLVAAESRLKSAVEQWQ